MTGRYHRFAVWAALGLTVAALGVLAALFALSVLAGVCLWVFNVGTEWIGWPSEWWRIRELPPGDLLAVAGKCLGLMLAVFATTILGIVALAVQSQVTSKTLVETLMVHPSMSEAITDAAE